jgi:hypothetical protein
MPGTGVAGEVEVSSLRYRGLRDREPAPAVAVEMRTPVCGTPPRCEPKGAVEVETVARVTPRADGRFRAAIPVPAGERAAV